VPTKKKALRRAPVRIRFKKMGRYAGAPFFKEALRSHKKINKKINKIKKTLREQATHP
jgi:hypothetical protein